MIISNELTAERLEEIKNFPITYDEGCPQLTKEQLARLKPKHPEYWESESVKVPLSIKIDEDVLAWFQSKGKGYQTRINAVLREAMLRGEV